MPGFTRGSYKAKAIMKRRGRRCVVLQNGEREVKIRKVRRIERVMEGGKKIEELQMTLNEVMRNNSLLRENPCNSFYFIAL